MPKPIQIVDEHDRPVGSAEKHEAWKQGLRHRVVRIMIENDAGQLLLQRRSEGRTLYPGCWDNSVGGHVDAGETYLAAARRELAEELGVSGVDLTEIGRFYTEFSLNGFLLKRFSCLFKATLNFTPKALQREEVAEVKWFSLHEVRALLHEHPGQVTSGLRLIMERFYSA